MMRLCEIRKSAGLSQEELSKRTGLTQAFICELERNKKNPSITTLLKLSSALSCSIDDLVTDPTEIVTETG